MSNNLCDWMPCVFCTLVFHGKYWHQWMSSRSMRGDELVLWEDILLDIILNLSLKQYVLSESCQFLYLYLYRYCAIYLLLYCMLEAWGYYFLYIYILFLFLTSTSIFLQMSELRRQIYSTQLQAKNSLWSLIHSLSANRLMMQKPSLFLCPLPLVAHYDVK